MTAPHHARVAFVMRFCEQFPDRDRETCIKAANKLMRNASAYRRLSVEIRDPWCTPFRREVAVRARDERAAAFAALCAEYGVTAILPTEGSATFHVQFPPTIKEVPS